MAYVAYFFAVQKYMKSFTIENYKELAEKVSKMKYDCQNEIKDKDYEISEREFEVIVGAYGHSFKNEAVVDEILKLQLCLGTDLSQRNDCKDCTNEMIDLLKVLNDQYAI